jgi:hypothetical protein
MAKYVWRAVGQVDFTESFRHFDEFPEIVYHYTDLDGILSILEKREFWFSRYDFLNDHGELKYGYDLLKNVGESFGSKKFKEFFFELLDDTFARSQMIYLLSCSESQDELGLWSYYSGLDNFNLGLQNQCMDDLGNYASCTKKETAPQTNSYEVLYFHEYFDWITGKVIYDAELQQKISRKFIKGLQEWYRNASPKTDEIKDSVDVLNIMKLLDNILILFKDPHFSMEHEYRYALRYKDQDPDSLKEFTHFRNSRGILVPYIKVGVHRPGTFRQITIGPISKMQEQEAGLKGYLACIPGNEDEIEIVKSEITVRF